MQTIKDLLTQQSFFDGMSAEHLELMAGCGRNVHYAAGETVLKEGEEADYFYVIRKGKIALSIDGKARGRISVQTMEEGEIIGWSWLIAPHIWHFTAKASESTHVVSLDGKCLREKCEKDHELGYQLLKRFSSVLAQRLFWTRLQLLDVYQ